MSSCLMSSGYSRTCETIKKIGGLEGRVWALNLIDGSGGGGDIGGISGPTSPSTTEPTADTSGADAAGAQQAALADAISNLGLSISVTEINEAQSNVQVSEDNSTIGN